MNTSAIIDSQEDWCQIKAGILQQNPEGDVLYLNIQKVQTMPYHPQSNGEVEMAHQTLQQMIRKLDNKLWKELVRSSKFHYEHLT